LPNPLFFRIHSAIAGVLHVSGTGEEIDAAVKTVGGAGVSGAIPVGDNFEHMFLRERLGGLLGTQLTVR